MNNKNLKALLKYSTIQKSKIIFATACSILNKICDILPEILLGLSIDVIENKEHSIMGNLGFKDPFLQLYIVGALTALFWILESIFEYLYSISWHSIAQDIQYTLRSKTFATLEELDLAYFENKTVGSLLNTIQDDIHQLEKFLSRGPNEIIQLITNIVVMGALFFYVSPTLALLSMLPIPFIIAIAYFFQNTLARAYATLRHKSASLTSHIAYRLQGIATIKSYTTESYELGLWRKECKQYQKANDAASLISSQYFPAVRMIIMVGFITSLVVGGIYTLQGIIPISWYAALVFLTQRFLWPFTSLTIITDMYERAQASAQRILDILQSPRTIQSGIEELTINAEEAKINFNAVSFAYAQNKNGMHILNNITFEIPAKKTVAFVGPTGSGKSTIIKLLLRFYDTTEGIISINNEDIKNLKLADLRKAIGLVSQEVYLVDGTIADNIAYGSFSASHEAIVEAAQMAQAHDFIMELPEGYNTNVAEGGKNLSGGQRQRLSIARAIIKKSSILIFDEATSAVDNDTEAAIQQSMTKLKTNHTIIIIAHRLSTVHNADIIFVLEKGEIVEFGNHEKLLQKNGAYAHLWNTQMH